MIPSELYPLVKDFEQRKISMFDLNSNAGGVRNAARSRHHQQQNNMTHSAIPMHMRNQQQPQHRGGPMTNQQQQTIGSNQPQQVLDYHDENLSDKEIYPGSIHQTGSGHQVGALHQGHNSMVNIGINTFNHINEIKVYRKFNRNNSVGLYTRYV